MSDSSLIPVLGTLGGTLTGVVLTYQVSMRTFQYQEKKEQRAQRIGRLRIQAWLRQVRLRIDRCRNEVQDHPSFGAYSDDLERATRDLLALLNDVPHDLTESQVLQCYSAAFRCKEAIYASDRNFEKALLLERTTLAFGAVAQAQTEIGDTDPEAYFS